MCVEANLGLSSDMREAFDAALEKEESPVGKKILGQLEENLSIAGEEKIPICQDTGMAVVFLKIGQDVHIVGDSVENSVNEGVRRGYRGGLSQKIRGKRPPSSGKIRRTITPAVIHYEMVPGDKLEITVAPKGFRKREYEQGSSC